MSDPAQDHKPTLLLEALADAGDSAATERARAMINALHPAEIAHLLEGLPPAPRKLTWELIDPALNGEVLLHLGDEARAAIMRDMDPEELIAATEGMDLDDLADYLLDLPATLIGEVLQSMDKQNRQRLESVMSYPEDSAGGLMNPDTITVRADVSIEVVLRYLRLRSKLPELTDALIVVDRHDRFQGMLPLSTLVTCDPARFVADVADHEVEPIPVSLSATAVAKRFQDLDLVSAAVVDADGRLLGRITIDDVVDVIRDEAERSIMHSVGLDEEADTFAPVLPSALRRSVWLGVNIISAFLAASVIGRFQATIEQIVALAVLMPIVASMGGVAGSQTLTLVVRGLALGHVSAGSARFLLYREAAVGLLNGLLWAAVVGLIAGAWFGNVELGLIIAAAMVVNLFTAGLAGVLIPLLLRRLGVDPALAGSVLLMTCTDVMGFLAFLGLATVFLL